MIKNPDNGRDFSIAIGIIVVVFLLAGGAFAGSIPDTPTGSDYIQSGSTPQSGQVLGSVLNYIVVSPSPSTTLTVGQKQNITSRVYDQYNNPMAGVDISWTVSNIGVGNVIPVKATTDVTGGVTSTFTALTKGIAIVNATNASIVSNSIGLIVKAILPGINVTSPNGGQNWVRGTTQTIKWNSTGSPGTYVKIELLKGGVFNRTIIASTPNDGTHPWPILATQAPGTDYKVKITSTTNAAYNDTSDNSFTIPAPSITVKNPNVTDIWIRGTTKIINWSSTESPKSYVKIELLKGGVFNRTIIASTLNDGSHPWPILATQAPGTDYQVRITSTANISVKNTSGKFTIPAPSITVKNPKSTDIWIRGTTRIINWSSTESPKSYVKIELLKGGNFSRTIIASTLNDGSHPWPILAAQPPGADYQVRITSTANISVKDISENFTIPIPSMTVTAPNGGQNWSKVITQTIKWNSTESPKSYVKIELLKAGVLNRVIIASTLNDGIHPWMIPTTQLIGSDYKIRINSTINSAITDSSNNNFNITS